MELQLCEIEKALDSGLYFIALQSTLALPDICGALQSTNGRASKSNYIAWYDSYAKEHDTLAMSADECYYFRCSLIHQGLTHHNNSSYSKIMFVVQPGFTIHNCIFNDVLFIDVNLFCRNIINAVRKWEIMVKNTEPFETNYKNLFRIYPNGIENYVSGCPVIS